MPESPDLLLERETELGQLDAALARAAGGQGCIALVHGEAGIGKTSLLRAFAARRAARARFLWGGCEALFTPRPLGPLHDIAAHWPGRMAQALRADAPRVEIFAALLDDLLRANVPTVLVFEDVHWADAATLDLLKYLGRRLRGHRTMVVASYRDDELAADHPLRTVIGDWPQRDVERVGPGPLSGAAVRDLARAAGRSDEGLHEISAGNPFFVTELLAQQGDGVPRTIRDAVLARLLRLPAADRQVVELVAAAPGSLQLEALERAAPGSGAALTAGEAAGLLRIAPRDVAFRHELARLAVLSSVPATRARELHRALLRALQADQPSPSQLARIVHHAAGCSDDAEVLRSAPRAAQQAAAVGAHREAAAHWRAAVDRARDLPGRELAVLLEGYAYEAYLISAIDEALAARQRALAIRRELVDAEGEGRNLRWISRLSWFLGQRESADEHARMAVSVLAATGRTREHALALSNLAQLCMLEQDEAGTLQWAEQAIAIALELGDDEVLAHALNNVGTARAMSGRRGEELRRSLELSLAHGFQEHAARAYTNLAAIATEQRDHGDALGWAEAGIAYAEERDLDSWTDYMLAYRARLLFELGRWDEAARDAQRVLGKPAQPQVARLPALAVLGRLRVRRGDSGARELLEEAWRLAQPTRELQRLFPVVTARAELDWLEGRPLPVDDLASVLALARSRPNPWDIGELVLWLRRGGSDPGGGTAAGPYALLLAGDWRAAAAAWASLGRPWEQADALAEGDEKARAEAIVQFATMGARPAAERVRRLLQQSGARSIPRGPRATTAANPAGLTARQMDVLRQLASGETYAQIGARLFVSAKTVEHHVAAILARLRVRSRGEAVERAREQGWIAAR